MAIEKLLGSFSKSEFLERYFLTLPFSLPGQAAEFMSLGTWNTLESILSGQDQAVGTATSPGSTAPDILVVKQGQRWNEGRVPGPREARELFQDGYTLLVRHAERHDTRLADLAGEFHGDFGGAVDVHLYYTPGTSHGFGWHYDAEDVFILQTSGEKEYSLRKNTVNPWPVLETLPLDMRYEREISPIMKCLLKAGDWLYIPNGYWHMARAESDSISLAVGVMARSALDVYDSLKRRLCESMMWRQRLPVIGQANEFPDDELVERYRVLLTELSDDLARMMREEGFLRSFLKESGFNEAMKP